MYINELTLMTIHRSTPCTRGFTPTALTTPIESDAPMKNIVMMSHLRAKPEMN